MVSLKARLLGPGFTDHLSMCSKPQQSGYLFMSANNTTVYCSGPSVVNIEQNSKANPILGHQKPSNHLLKTEAMILRNPLLFDLCPCLVLT